MAKDDWIGKITGHVAQARARFAEDKAQWTAAKNAPRSIILTDDQIKGRDWDAAKILHTTLGGKYRPITIQDLPTFHENMQRARAQWGRIGGKKKSDKLAGITPRQVINMASARPLDYVYPVGSYHSDIDKARREITSAIPLSANRDLIRFRTNAGRGSNVSSHNVFVQLLQFEDAVSAVSTADPKDKKAAYRAARSLRSGYVKFDCDCGRHRFFFRYIATQGGWAYGRQETGFPKIRNPYVMGCACKHVIRVMTELESSSTVLAFLERHLNNQKERTGKTQLKQKEAQEALAAKKTVTKIKTSVQRAREARRRAQIRAADKAQVPPNKNIKKAASSRRTQTMSPAQQNAAIQSFARQFGLDPKQLKALIESNGNKGG